MAGLRARLRDAQQDPEEGSITVWVVIGVLSMTLLAGLAVDFVGQAHAKGHAQDLAFEAARAGAQQLAGPGAILGTGATVDPAAARQAARAYLAGDPDVTGDVTIAAGAVVVVDTRVTYATKYLNLINVNEFVVTGHAEVQVTRVVGGVER